MAQQIVRTTKTEDGTIVVTTEQKVRVWMQVVLSLIMVAVGILIVSAPDFAFKHNFGVGTRELAAGWVGLVLGFWFP